MQDRSSDSSRPLLLCIDDAEVALRVRKLVLSSAGYSVLTASSAEAGLELFQQNPVDLVIADHFLTAKTGTEIAKEMKALKPNVPILIVSASAEKPSGIECVDEFLPKGDAPEVVLDAIDRLLKERCKRNKVVTG